jgi:hypothetical protein
MLRLLTAALVITYGCAGRDTQVRPRLPALAPGSGVDNTLVFQLPDSGGYLVNGVAIEPGRIDTIIGEAFSSRPADLRAVIVWDNPRRDWADIQRVATAARVRGGAAYDAAASGWPRVTETLPR